MAGYSKMGFFEGLLSKCEQEFKKGKKLLESAKDGIASNYPIYTSLGGFAIEKECLEI